MMPTPDKEIIRADNNCRRRTSTAGEEQLTLTASARTIDIDRERARSRIFLPLPPRAATKAFSPLFFSPSGHRLTHRRARARSAHPWKGGGGEEGAVAASAGPARRAGQRQTSEYAGGKFKRAGVRGPFWGRLYKHGDCFRGLQFGSRP